MFILIKKPYIFKFKMAWISETNGELDFFNKIKNDINVIFDVGCRSDSIFTDFEGEVHYFDPVKNFIEKLSNQKNKNKISYFNTFGLGSETKDSFYYPGYQSFYDRTVSCMSSDASQKVLLSIKKSKDYIIEKNIKSIDFLKIDTEGSEFDVLKGFEELLENIKIIQFEYGGTFMDNNVKLIDLINYLSEKGFEKFSYIIPEGQKLMTNFSDNYEYCNIVCINKNSDIVPF
jgi:FkbM family methyltransferase